MYRAGGGGAAVVTASRQWGSSTRWLCCDLMGRLRFRVFCSQPCGLVRGRHSMRAQAPCPKQAREGAGSLDLPWDEGLSFQHPVMDGLGQQPGVTASSSGPCLS